MGAPATSWSRSVAFYLAITSMLARIMIQKGCLKLPFSCSKNHKPMTSSFILTAKCGGEKVQKQKGHGEERFEADNSEGSGS